MTPAGPEVWGQQHVCLPQPGWSPRKRPNHRIQVRHFLVFPSQKLQHHREATGLVAWRKGMQGLLQLAFTGVH